MEAEEHQSSGRLVFRHESGGEGFRFEVQRVGAAGTKAAPAVAVADPMSQALGRDRPAPGC